MEFGFYLNKKRYLTDNIEIKPLWDIDESLSWFYNEARVCKGWLYPEDQSCDQNSQEKINNKHCTVPVKWFSLEPTHSITIYPYDSEKLKFLILCLGFINGIYLTPAGYYFLEKVPYKQGVLTDVVPTKGDIEKGLTICSNFYDRNPEQRKGIFSVLHWFLNAQSYAFPWDRFDAQYKVLDGLYKISRLNSPNHASRAIALAEKFNVITPDWAKINGKSSKLSKLRNDLVHEAIYAGQPIGYNHPDENYDLYFRRFNAKLIAATLGFQSYYIQSNPNDRQTYGWDLL